MSFTLESLIIVVIAILPGFLSAAVRATLKPDERPSAGEWVASSIVASLGLNAVAFWPFVFWSGRINLALPLATMKGQLAQLTGEDALRYVALLYLISIVWGIASGLAGKAFTPRVLAYRLRLTPISPASNVFTDVLDRLVRTSANLRLRGNPDQQVPWLRLKRDGKLIQGRLRQSSVTFDVGEPIEVFLSPAYVFEGGSVVQPISPVADVEYLRGLYLRLKVDDVTEVMVAPAKWNPLAPLLGAAGGPAPPAAAARGKI